MRLILQEFVSLDGVCQGPGAPDEDTTDGFTRGGWFVPFIEEVSLARVTAWTATADAFLFGRRTYQAFAQAWPAMDDPGDPVATALNHRPKYVVSTTLREAVWGPAEIITVDQVAGLRKREGGELQIHGSGRLGAALLADGLVDEVRLAVAPVVVGQGRRLFPSDGTPVGLRLTGAETTPTGLSLLTYEYAGEPSYCLVRQLRVEPPPSGRCRGGRMEA